MRFGSWASWGFGLLWVGASVGCGGRSQTDAPRLAGASGTSAGNADSAEGNGDDSASAAGDSNGGEAVTTTAPAVELWSGSTALLDVFVGRVGIYVVLQGEVLLFDHRGTPLLTRVLDGAAVSAAFDEERLTLSDGGRVTTYDAQLEVLHAFDAPTGCVMVAAFSRQRIVCAAYYYGFTAFDGASGVQLSGPDYLHFGGSGISRVPGSDDFVAGSAAEQAFGFNLFRLEPDGRVSLLGMGTLPAAGEFSAYGFDGGATPALITDSGAQLVLHPDCSPTSDGSSSACVEKHDVPTIAAGNELVAIAPGPAAHEFFGLIDTPQPGDPRPCPQGHCDLELIDDLNGRVLRHRQIDVDALTIVAFRADAQAHGVVLGSYRIRTDSDPAVHSSVVLQPF